MIFYLRLSLVHDAGLRLQRALEHSVHVGCDDEGARQGFGVRLGKASQAVQRSIPYVACPIWSEEIRRLKIAANYGYKRRELHLSVSLHQNLR